MRDTHRIHPADRPRPRLLRIAIIGLVALAVFVIAVAVSLPWDKIAHLMIGRFAADAGWQIRFDYGRLVPAGVLLAGLEIEPRGPAAGRRRPPVRIDTLVATPSVRGLLTGRRGVPWRARAQLYGGRARGRLEGTPGTWHVDVEWDDIDLARLPLPPTTHLSGSSGGQVTISITESAPQTTLSAAENDRARVTGSWTVRAHDLVASGLRGGNMLLPPVTVSQLASSGTWSDRRVEVSTLSAEGPLGTLDLRGRLMLREPTENSAINADLTYAAPHEPPADVAALLKLFLPPDAQQVRSYHVTGTLAAPSLTAAPPR